MLVKMRNGDISNGNLKSRFRANRRDFLAMKRNKIPLPFIVSILKPIIKLPQYYSSYAKQFAIENKEEDFLKLPLTYFPADR
ncbi:MAG TPA: hypothetical protein VMU83_06555 [Hanamia sp.]|nr:hypothetical protein [Hanamia sp.]